MSGPRSYSEGELRIARAIYRVLRENKDALVDGSPEDDEHTLIDGIFDLREIAKSILQAISDRGGDG
jgi:hypothetical protein